MHDFSQTLIRCSSLGYLFTEPKDVAAKKNGDLSKTAQSHLIEVYAKEIWDIERDIVTPAMRKGTEAEESGITLLSRVDKRIYVKNEERKVNEYVSGHPDIVIEEEIIDLKLSFDALTFLPKLIEPIDKMYDFQIQGYLWLFDKKRGRISYALTDTPDNIIQGEKYRLLRSMDVVSEESPQFIAAAKKLESNMRFSHIPKELRVINHYVERNNEVIEKIPSKVKKAREFLMELYEKHLEYYSKMLS
jgi:hypothetical protein